MERIERPPSLPGRSADAHKGDVGRILVVAGSTGLSGAAALAAAAAMRSGSGLVTVACPRSLNAVLEVKLTEAMTLPLDETSSGTLALSAFDRIAEFSRRCDCVAIGPGLGRHPETSRLARRLLAELVPPVILDADGLNAFANDAAALAERGGRLVLTPHPGEAAGLLGVETSAIQGDREGAALKLAGLTQGVVLLKGAGTIVSDGARIYVNSTGNPGMASGGTGDVLTGVIASLVGQGLGEFDAACAGARLHGLAGDVAAREKGEAGLIASDLVEALPEAARLYIENAGGETP